MGRSAEEELASEWSFTETLSLDDVEILQRQQLEDGEVCTVSYACAIQGRDTSKISYRELRKVCSYLGVRYYKNRPKNLMLELIALKKLKGEVPERYKLAKTTDKNTTRPPIKDIDIENDDENHDRTSVMECNPPYISSKRQRITTVESLAATITSSSATNTFLQPVSPSGSDLRPSSPTNCTSGIPATPTGSKTPRIYVEMSLKDRIDTFNLLRHVRQQIQSVEEAICNYTESDMAQISTIKIQRLTEDLQFYLAERRSLIRQLGNSR